MSLMKVRVLEFQENAQINDTNLGKVFYVPPCLLEGNLDFEIVFNFFNAFLFLFQYIVML